MHDPFYDLFPPPPPAEWNHGEVALMTIDMQYMDAHRDGWMGRVAKAQGKESLLAQRYEAIDAALPNIRRVQDAFRASGQEVIHVRIAFRTEDGREAGRAYMPFAARAGVPARRARRRDPRRGRAAGRRLRLLEDLVQCLQHNRRRARALEPGRRDASRLHWPRDRRLCRAVGARRGRPRLPRDARRGHVLLLDPEAHADAIQRMTDGGFVVACSADKAVGRGRGSGSLGRVPA